LGTDFELAVAANGADTIKLYKGALDVTRPDGTGLVRLQAGHMMTIGADGALGAPAPL